MDVDSENLENLSGIKVQDTHGQRSAKKVGGCGGLGSPAANRPAYAGTTRGVTISANQKSKGGCSIATLVLNSIERGNMRGRRHGRGWRYHGWRGWQYIRGGCRHLGADQLPGEPFGQVGRGIGIDYGFAVTIVGNGIYLGGITVGIILCSGADLSDQCATAQVKSFLDCGGQCGKVVLATGGRGDRQGGVGIRGELPAIGDTLQQITISLGLGKRSGQALIGIILAEYRCGFDAGHPVGDI